MFMEDISDSILIDKEVTRMFNKDVLYEADFDKVDNIPAVVTPSTEYHV